MGQSNRANGRGLRLLKTPKNQRCRGWVLPPEMVAQMHREARLPAWNEHNEQMSK
jgi:hypothetical protein